MRNKSLCMATDGVLQRRSTGQGQELGVISPGQNPRVADVRREEPRVCQPQCTVFRCPRLDRVATQTVNGNNAVARELAWYLAWSSGDLTRPRALEACIIPGSRPLPLLVWGVCNAVRTFSPFLSFPELAGASSRFHGLAAQSCHIAVEKKMVSSNRLPVVALGSHAVA